MPNDYITNEEFKVWTEHLIKKIPAHTTAPETKDMIDDINCKLNILAKIPTDIEYIKRDIKEIKDKLKSDYVTRQEFDPIKKLVYGLVSLILIAVVGSLMALIVK